MDIKESAQKYNDYIIERRRYYHTRPELSGQEKNTRESIKKDLEAIGITDIRLLDNCYGLVAMLKGGKPGKTVALRADIDALCVKEETGLPFASENEGAMHACGHDSHIAMALGAAKILYDIKDELCGDVRFLFQPAEEIATGALDMTKEGAVDGVDAVYGAHVWGVLQAPKIDVSAGNRMACCHGFTIEVNGVAAHGSAPHLGVDAITASASIIENLQQIVSRQNDPLNPLVITVGKINGGTRFNVIPNKVVMEGTVRTFSLGTEIEDKMRKIIRETAQALGCTADITEYTYMTVPVINMDDNLNKIAHDAVVKTCGAEAISNLPAMMGSEDFSWFGKDGVPYFYAFIGSANPDKGITYTNHHEKYTVDEDILHNGSAVMAQFAADFLNQ